MATSKLKRKFGDMLDINFPQYRIRENYRPNWLISSDNTWLELDFYIEDLKIAYEVQGRQHFQYIPFFHGSNDNFEKRKRYDQEKRDLCYGHGVKLIEICTETDLRIAIKELSENNAVKRAIHQHVYVSLSQEIQKEPLKEPSRKLINAMRRARRHIRKHPKDRRLIARSINRAIKFANAENYKIIDEIINSYLESTPKR